MKKIFLTGSTGFIGRNILPLLRNVPDYEVLAPSRADLNLLDCDAVRSFIASENFDAVIHFANPTAQNPLDPRAELFERSLRVFSALEACSHLYGKMIYLGSGAEYGKHRSISSISEDEFGLVLPVDPYGFSRFIMSKLSASHDNIINLRVFGCYGPGDPEFKLIPFVINCIKCSDAVRLRRDVFFDFLFVEDIFPVILYFLENTAHYPCYNLCSGMRIRISSIAEEILSLMNSNLPIIFNELGLAPEYTGSNFRLSNEIRSWLPTPISEGIGRIIRNENWKS